MRFWLDMWSLLRVRLYSPTRRDRYPRYNTSQSIRRASNQCSIRPLWKKPSNVPFVLSIINPSVRPHRSFYAFTVHLRHLSFIDATHLPRLLVFVNQILDESMHDRSTLSYLGGGALRLSKVQNFRRLAITKRRDTLYRATMGYQNSCKYYLSKFPYSKLETPIQSSSG